VKIKIKIINLITDIFLNLVLDGSLRIRLEGVDGITENQRIADEKDGSDGNKEFVFNRKPAVKSRNLHKILSFVDKSSRIQ
jgi:hypothetical protein